MNRRWLQCKAGEPVDRRVAGQVDQDVDGVGPDRRRQLPIGNPYGRTPAVGMGPEPLGQIVFLGAPRIADELHPGRVRRLQDSVQKVPRRMAPQICGDQPDAKRFIDITRVGIRRKGMARMPVSRAPSAMRAAQGFVVLRRVIVEAKEIVAVGRSEVRLDAHGLFVGGQGFLELALFLEDDPAVVCALAKSGLMRRVSS